MSFDAGWQGASQLLIPALDVSTGLPAGFDLEGDFVYGGNLYAAQIFVNASTTWFNGFPPAKVGQVNQ